MAVNKKEWHYFDEEKGQWVSPVVRDELDALFAAGKINESTEVINTLVLRQRGPKARAIPYSALSKVDIGFDPPVDTLYADRTDKPTTIFSGPNNCGKTLLLKQLFSLVGRGGYLIGCSRFSHVDILNTRQRAEQEHFGYYDNFMQNFYTSHQNTEDNEIKLEQVITGLKDVQRDILFSISKDLLGNEFSLKRTEVENSFSPFYVDVDGKNLRFASSGTRLLLTLLGMIMDDRFSVLLIDEPEIGLSPRVQAAVANFLYEPSQRQKFCPHLRQVYVATHSHLFLDRRTLSNNYIVTKADRTVLAKHVQSFADLHQLQFRMLGNDLESIYLPSAILIVEGDSDVTFISKIVQLHIPDRKVAVVRAGGDGEVQNKLNVLKEAFGELQTSPYRERLFIALDKRHSVSGARIEKQGVLKTNLCVWSRNGIEYLYPPELVAQAFSCGVHEVAKVDCERDPMEFNAVRRSKKELAQLVTDNLASTHALHPELDNLIKQIRAACR